VAYNALTPELTPDYDERSSLNGYRMVYSISGTLGAIVFATVLGWYVADPRALFAVIGVALGLVSMVPPRRGMVLADVGVGGLVRLHRQRGIQTRIVPGPRFAQA